jgi:hypothetical protein
MDQNQSTLISLYGSECFDKMKEFDLTRKDISKLLDLDRLFEFENNEWIMQFLENKFKTDSSVIFKNKSLIYEMMIKKANYLRTESSIELYSGLLTWAGFEIFDESGFSTNYYDRPISEKSAILLNIIKKINEDASLNDKEEYKIVFENFLENYCQKIEENFNFDRLLKEKNSLLNFNMEIFSNPKNRIFLKEFKESALARIESFEIKKIVSSEKVMEKKNYKL